MLINLTTLINPTIIDVLIICLGMKQYEQKTERFSDLNIVEQKGNKFYVRYNLRFFNLDNVKYCFYSEAILNHNPTKKDKEKLEQYDKKRAKEHVMEYVDYYYKETKEFFYKNGSKSAWLNSEQRSTILDSILLAKLKGDTTISIYLNDDIFILDLERARNFILAIQNYSQMCYQTYMKHKKVLNDMNDLNLILDYDPHNNYPNKLYF